MKTFLLFFFSLLCANTFAQSFDQLWQQQSAQHISIPGKRTIIPKEYLLYKMNTSSFKLMQGLIPTEGANNQIVISLPTPEGIDMQFSVFEKPMMQKELGAKYPFIKTYTAISLKDARITAKLDYTVWGFHAAIFNGTQTFYIDPYNDMTDSYYVVYFKQNFSKVIAQHMACEVDDQLEDIVAQPQISLGNGLPAMSFKTSGDTIRNYRLALACTEEYAAAVGGITPTKASVLSAMVTSINRVNGVFEKEFSMHANLIGNNDTLIFLPGSSDPYTNGSGSTMLGENQSTITSYIGSSNYDYGHVFSTGGGGIASLGSVCGTNKAQGVTGSANPVGDPFDIDYVAHEMGHQFGGSHTFNSITGSCSGNRSSSSAYEIGSATTIMGYAGICGTDDIQPHSDDYYHIRSLEQMTANNVKACAAITLSGNALPQLVSINKNYIVPYKTPFELTASAADANNDPLTYCWEQYNRGGNGAAWNAPTTVAPILRSFLPDTSATRVFPQYKELIKNTESYLGERLPDTARILKFRCTVRDIHNGYGAFFTSTDTTKLDVRSTGSTLFRVLSQNTIGQTWNGYSYQTITWEKAGTDVAPVAATNVDIYLSVDSGRTWPYVLATATPNDGSEQIGVPNVGSKWARVKVKASGNVFFDLNDNWINIIQDNSPAGIKSTSKSQLNIYPIPSNGTIHVELPEYAIGGKIEILDLLGHLMSKTTISTTGTLVLELNRKGIYFIKLYTTKGDNYIQKVIIQ